jgi:ABC-type transporter Mla subunit MlaD
MSSDKDEQSTFFQAEGDVGTPVEETSSVDPEDIREIRSDIERIKNAINELVKEASKNKGKTSNGATQTQENGEADLKDAANQVKRLLEGNLQNNVQSIEGLASDLQATQKSIEEEAGKIEDLRLITEEAIEKRLQNIDNEIATFFEGQDEKLEEIGEALERPISAVAEKVESDLREFIEHFNASIDNINQETEERIKHVGQAAAQIKRVASRFESKEEDLKKKIKYITNAKAEIEEYVDQARTTAAFLEKAALQDDIQRLEELAEKSVKRIIHVAGETQSRMVKQIQSEMNDLLNKVDEKRMKFDSNMELIDKRMGQKLQEMKTVKEAVEDLEQKHKQREEALIREAKSITRREIALIVTSVFCSVICAILILYFAGVV